MMEGLFMLNLKIPHHHFASLMVPLPDKRGGTKNICSSPLVGEGDRALLGAWWWGIPSQLRQPAYEGCKFDGIPA